MGRRKFIKLECSKEGDDNMCDVNQEYPSLHNYDGGEYM